MNTGAERQVTRRACGFLYKMLGLLCSDREEVRSIFEILQDAFHLSRICYMFQVDGGVLNLFKHQFESRLTPQSGWDILLWSGHSNLA